MPLFGIIPTNVLFLPPSLTNFHKIPVRRPWWQLGCDTISILCRTAEHILDKPTGKTVLSCSWPLVLCNICRKNIYLISWGLCWRRGLSTWRLLNNTYFIILQPYDEKCRVTTLWFIKGSFKGAAAYQLGNTSSRMITEVKQCWAWLVLGDCSSVAWVLMLTPKVG